MPSEDLPRRTVITGRLHTGHDEHEDGLVVVEDGRVRYAGPRFGRLDAGGAEHLDLAPGQTVVPGLVDVHCHGGFGADFTSSPAAELRRALRAFHEHGTTTLVASLVTAPRADLLAATARLVPPVREGLAAGLHLEGPFLSRARCGAQDPAWLWKPDLELAAELADAAAGTLRTMTVAPELPRSRELVELLVARGVLPSLGHTDADAATTEEALRHLAALLGGAGRVPAVTHLFNAMPPVHHRAPGPVPACLRAAARGAAVVELVADGVHLDPYVVRWVFELVGADGIALVTDATAAAGLADGDHVLGSAAVRVRGGVATLAGAGANAGTIAGGTATLLEVLRRTVAGGVPLGDALRAATVVPARVLGLTGQVGALVPKAFADLLVVDDRLGLVRVLRRGRWLRC